MQAVNLPDEQTRRKRMINKHFSDVRNESDRDNASVKNNIDKNFINIRNVFGNLSEFSNVISEMSNGLCIALMDYENDENSDIVGDFKGAIQDAYLKLFNSKRSNALVDILKQRNDRVYDKEGIESLKFDKDEILKGFDEEVVRKEGTVETLVKTAFWANKLTKLLDYVAIDKLKNTPAEADMSKNYFKARKRLEILKLLNGQEDFDAFKELRDEYSDEYKEKFGVSIEEDNKTLREVEHARKSLYGLKNGLMLATMGIYMGHLKMKKDMPGVQQMGITKNDYALSDSTGAYMAVVKLKGYTSNIYMHVPTFAYAEAYNALGNKWMHNVVPETIYSEADPEKVLPVNVICKVEKGSNRYKKIQEERKQKPKNKALAQADIQTRFAQIPPYKMSGKAEQLGPPEIE